jgi:hypothetical protein
MAREPLVTLSEREKVEVLTRAILKGSASTPVLEFRLHKTLAAYLFTQLYYKKVRCCPHKHHLLSFLYLSEIVL